MLEALVLSAICPPAEVRLLKGDATNLFWGEHQAQKIETSTAPISCNDSDSGIHSALRSDSTIKQDLTIDQMSKVFEEIERGSAQLSARFFEEIFSTRGSARESLISEYVKWVTPDLIVKSAISSYQGFGNEDRLRLAVALLTLFPDEKVVSALELSLANGLYDDVIFNSLESLNASDEGVKYVLDRIYNNLASVEKV